MYATARRLAAMNGGNALAATLVDSGVTVCFANPGTTEMQFVAALERERRLRPVLCLFEGVATGAADGYGRMTGAPACTLLHLGPGYSNGASNLHNARRAGTPIVNIVGDHATHHRELDPPLNSDIHALVALNSNWLRSANSADAVGPLAAAAVAASFGPPGGAASLIVPSNSAWSSTSFVGTRVARAVRAAPARSVIDLVAARVRGARKAAILLGGGACSESGLHMAGRLAALGLRLLTDTFVPRQARGAGRFSPERMEYFSEEVIADLAGIDLLVLVETGMPVAFFAYPDKPVLLVPAGCESLTLATRLQDGAAALESLADALGAPAQGPQVEPSLPDAPTGRLTASAVGAAIARHMPAQAIVSDDATTSGPSVFESTREARQHDWLMLSGGALGQGIPVALGAAIACPSRQVIALTGDGAAMYTLQALWTIARENLNVTVVVMANHAYRILELEFQRAEAAEPGPAARSLIDLAQPRIDWVSLAVGMGVTVSESCHTAENFDASFARAMNRRGPALIQANLTSA